MGSGCFKIGTFKEYCIFVLQIFTVTTLFTDFTKPPIKILKIMLSKPNGRQSSSIWVKEESYQVVKLTLHTGNQLQSNKHHLTNVQAIFLIFLLCKSLNHMGT